MSMSFVIPSDTFALSRSPPEPHLVKAHAANSYNETYMTLGAVESMAFDPQTSQLYFPELSVGGVVVVDADADVVLTPLPIDVGGMPRDLVVVRFGTIFSDGFESGDTTRWSDTVP